MAVSLRVDQATLLANGTIEIRYTYGTPPLPVSWQGTGFVVLGSTGTLAPSQDAETSFTEFYLVSLLLNKRLQSDPEFATPSGMNGSTVTIDLAQATNPVTWT